MTYSTPFISSYEIDNETVEMKFANFQITEPFEVDCVWIFDDNINITESTKVS